MARTRSITSIEAEISKVSSELKQAQEKADALSQRLLELQQMREPLTEFSRKDIEYHRVTIGIHLLRICYCN